MHTINLFHHTHNYERLSYSMYIKRKPTDIYVI